MRRALAVRRAWVAAGLILYGIGLATSPVLHHDLVCHLKTPYHCDACHASPVAPRAVPHVKVVPPVESEASRVESREETASLAPVPLHSSGRAPPSA
jgi:hypothetical protein